MLGNQLVIVGNPRVFRSISIAILGNPIEILGNLLVIFVNTLVILFNTIAILANTLAILGYLIYPRQSTCNPM